MYPTQQNICFLFYHHFINVLICKIKLRLMSYDKDRAATLQSWFPTPFISIKIQTFYFGFRYLSKFTTI